ncbi:hypothetical protein EB235_20135 [Mesorhizobium loti R88b]|uniref:Uncharacterized protein n=1 Tax=Mesorhizobium loti R88b TaxID=935548 RepID=A0A6M7WNE5_RHILI|nr:hypothetical protein EB235_20135 [Mesorhizobium loti R88b]
MHLIRGPKAYTPVELAFAGAKARELRAEIRQCAAIQPEVTAVQKTFCYETATSQAKLRYYRRKTRGTPGRPQRHNRRTPASEIPVFKDSVMSAASMPLPATEPGLRATDERRARYFQRGRA